MANTIYATFLTEGDAERAAGALMDHGVAAEEISFIVPETATPVLPETASTLPRTHSVDAAPPASQPLPDSIPVPDLQIPPSPPLPNEILGQVGHLAEPTEGAKPGYTYDALGAVLPDHLRVRPAPPMPVPSTPAPAAVVPAADIATLPADTPIDTVEHDPRPHIVDMNRQLPTAASGISTTTAGDAAKGALEGAAVGVGLGILLGLATVAIPGIGLVAGTGALVASLAAATGAAGGVAGGVYGYLADQGVPPDTARQLSDHMQSGSPLLSIAITGRLPEEEIFRLLKKYGATSAQAF